MSAKATLLILVITAAILVGYDIYATVKGPEYTITSLIRLVSKDHPIIPWIIGYLCGSWIRKVTTIQR